MSTCTYPVGSCRFRLNTVSFYTKDLSFYQSDFLRTRRTNPTDTQEQLQCIKTVPGTIKINGPSAFKQLPSPRFLWAVVCGWIFGTLRTQEGKGYVFLWLQCGINIIHEWRQSLGMLTVPTTVTGKSHTFSNYTTGALSALSPPKLRLIYYK